MSIRQRIKTVRAGINTAREVAPIAYRMASPYISKVIAQAPARVGDGVDQFLDLGISQAGNRLDKVIGIFNPRLEAERAAYRQTAKALYEGASRSERVGNWTTYNTGPNEENRPALEVLRARSRDLVRNNWAAQRAIHAWADNVVGTGIMPSCNIPELDALVQKWALSTKADADEKLDIYGLQNLIMKTIVEAGECLVIRERRDSKHGSPLPFQLRVLEPDHLPVEAFGQYDNKDLIQGIEFDRFGRRKAYYLYEDHPGEGFGSLAELKRFAARDVIHAYRIDRPGQVRGIPWLSPSMLMLRDYDEFDDAQLQRQKIAACFSAFVREATSAVNMGMQQQKSNATHLSPASIVRLGPGEDVSFAQPPGVDGYADYSRIKMHQIAMGVGIPYSTLTGDLSQVNFSSGRMGWIEFERSIKSVRDHVLFTQALQTMGEWFLEAARDLGYDTENAVITWTAPVREVLDPLTEIEASNERIRTGLSTPQKEIRKHGNDPYKNLDDLEEWNKELDKRGIRLDSDPRAVGMAGSQVIESPKQLESEEGHEKE